jgi:hypothetical protein
MASSDRSFYGAQASSRLPSMISGLLIVSYRSAVGTLDLPSEPEEPARTERGCDRGANRPKTRNVPDPDERGRAYEAIRAHVSAETARAASRTAWAGTRSGRRAAACGGYATDGYRFHPGSAPVFTCRANRRHAPGRNASTGPSRSLVSRTSTRSPESAATSTQLPLVPLWLDWRGGYERVLAAIGSGARRRSRIAGRAQQRIGRPRCWASPAGKLRRLPAWT